LTIRFRLRIGKFPKYLKDNPGAPFILTFILTLIVDAAIYPSNANFANDLTSDAFILLVIGVVLRVIAVAREKGNEDLQPGEQQNNARKPDL